MKVYRREFTDLVKAEIIDRYFSVKDSVSLTDFAKTVDIGRPVLLNWFRNEEEIKFRVAMKQVNLVRALFTCSSVLSDQWTFLWPFLCPKQLNDQLQ